MNDPSRRDILTYASALGASAFVPDIGAAANVEPSPELLALKSEVDKLIAGYDVAKHFQSLQYQTIFSERYVGPVLHTRVLSGGAGQRFVFAAPTYETDLAFSLMPNGTIADAGQMLHALVNSVVQYREMRAAEVFNNGLTYDASIGGDGVSLFSDRHPYDTGVWSNEIRPTMSADIWNERSVSEFQIATMQAIIAARKLVDEGGLRILARARKLVVPVGWMSHAERTTRSELRPASAPNPNVYDPLALDAHSMGSPFVWDYLSKDAPWFVLTDVKGLVWCDHGLPKLASRINNGMVDVLIHDKCGFWYTDPRAVVGIFPKMEGASA